MSVGWETYLDRLGPQGLRVVLAGLLPERELSALTGRDVDDLGSNERALLLVDRVAEEPALGRRLLETLDRQVGSRDGLDEHRVREEIAAALRDPDPAAAAMLHQVARRSRPLLPAPELRAAADMVAAALLGDEPVGRPKWVAKVATDRAGVRELEEDRRELETRVRQLEGQLARALERSADLEEQLSERLGEVRQLRQGERRQREELQRLERECHRLGKRIEDQNERRARERTGEVTTALRRLTKEQRRAAAALEKLRERLQEVRGEGRQQGRRVGTMSELLEKVVALHEAQSRSAAAAQEEILRELATLREAVAAPPSETAPPRRGSRRGAGEQPVRVALFVDVQNMFYGAREKGARVDFEALLATTSNDRQLVRAVAYLVETKEIDQSAFIHLLQMKAYEVKRKPLRVRPDRSAKGNWDLEMALDAIETADQIDVVVLATGDGDFVPLVRQLKLRGLRVEVYGFPRSTAPDLREAADRFFPITKRLLRAPRVRKSSERTSRTRARADETDEGADEQTAPRDEPSEAQA